MTASSKILITGANGFTGNHACQHFKKLGMDVIAVVRQHSTSTPNMDHIETCNLTNQPNVTKLINKVKPDYILHLAGQNHVLDSWKDPLATIEANVLSTLYLLESIRKNDYTCKIIVIGSALQFDPKVSLSPPHPYSLSKTIQSLIGKSWSNLYDLNIILAKPTNLIGPGHSNGVCSIFAKKIVSIEKGLSANSLEIQDGSVQLDFLDVRDAVLAYEHLLKFGKQGEEYEIATGSSRTLNEVIAVYQALAKKNIIVQYSMKETHSEPVKMNISKISALGWKPQISFKTSLKDILHYYRNL